VRGRSVFPIESSHWNDPDHSGAFYLRGQTGRFTDWLFGRMESTVQNCKFCPGNVFTICTNQFLWPKNGHKGLKLVSKMALKKWNSTFWWELSVRKTQVYLFWCTVAPLKFSTRSTRKFAFIYIPTGIPGTCWYKTNVDGKRPSRCVYFPTGF